MTQNFPKELLNIAIIPNKLLGDGIIVLILANNLFKNHFKVTIFQDFLIPFQAWLPFDIQPVNENTVNMDTLNTFDIVLADTYSTFTERYTYEEIETIAKDIIFYSTGRLQQQYHSNPLNYLRKKLTGDKTQFIPHFINASRTIKYNKTLSMVDNMHLYCSETLNLPVTTNETGFIFPEKSLSKKNNKRIIISPTSSLKKKEWSAQQFFSLARKIRADGYDIVFSCAPNERPYWIEKLNNEFELPEFKSINLFAEYLYESALLIGNDSGAGHLASAMGIPVVTLVTGPKKRKFRWRPGWGEDNIVITPCFSLSLFGKRYWCLFLPVKKVYSSFKNIMEPITRLSKSDV